MRPGRLALSRFSSLEELVTRDEGNRGLGPLFAATRGHLRRAAGDLCDACPPGERNVITIMTGFPCNLDLAMKQENDGPPGALAIARTVAMMGHDAVIATDQGCAPVIQSCLDLFANDLTCGSIRVSSFSPGATWSEDDEQRKEELMRTSAHVVAVERTGVTAEGTYLTMSARDMSHVVAPLDSLFDDRRDGVRATAIGDGGNELGMGKVYPLVRQSIANGDVIASVTTCDNLIVSSVSNWGGYALVAGVAVEACARGWSASIEHALRDTLPSEEHEMAIHSKMIELGVVDGKGRKPWDVDGMPVATSMAMLRMLRAAAAAEV